MLLPLSACTPDQPPQTTVFDPQVEALNKAKQLEAQLQKDADNQRRAIEAAEAAPETKGY
jgi:hypothetical protein